MCAKINNPFIMKRDFKRLSDQLLKTNIFSGMKDLQALLNYIDGNNVINEFILNHNSNKVYEEKDLHVHAAIGEIPLPTNRKERNHYIYHYLKNGLEKYSDYYQLAIGYSSSYYVQEAIDNFNCRFVNLLIVDVYNYLEQIDSSQ